MTAATGINDNGWIVGDATNINSGLTHAFLLSPTTVPVPGAVWLFGSGLIGLLDEAANAEKAGLAEVLSLIHI